MQGQILHAACKAILDQVGLLFTTTFELCSRRLVRDLSRKISVVKLFTLYDKSVQFCT